MDIVVLFNGLGNQMSQYAFYLSKKHYSPHCKMVFYNGSKNNHNGYELERIFGIKSSRGIVNLLYQVVLRVLLVGRFKTICKILNLLCFRITKEAQNYDFNPELLTSKHRIGMYFYYGGWHSEKNFISIKDEVKATFKFPVIEDSNCLRYVDLIKQEPNSVSVHIRRGDFLNSNPKHFHQFEGVATLDYYKKAIDRIKQEVGRCTFFVFSNDLEWCKSEFVGENYYFVDCNTGEYSWRDMYLMTLCKHHINANSTFSWWGAWLSEKEGITICPQRFVRTAETKDFYPNEWLKI